MHSRTVFTAYVNVDVQDLDHVLNLEQKDEAQAKNRGLFCLCSVLLHWLNMARLYQLAQFTVLLCDPFITNFSANNINCIKKKAPTIFQGFRRVI